MPVPGGPVWYEITGNGGGVPILALHGGPGGTSCAYTRLAPLAAGRPVIRYDQLGTGRSGRPSDPSLWRAERYVEELHAVRQALGLDRIHLLGHSWGGALAALYVLEKGTDGIVSLTLSSPLLSTRAWIEDTDALRRSLPADVQATLSRHEAAGTTDSDEYRAAEQVFNERYVWAGERIPTPGCEGAPGNEFIYKTMWGPTEFHATGNLLDFDVTARLSAIDVPVLFIAGEHDEARPETLDGFRAAMPDARLVVIEGAGHATLGRKPVKYREVLAGFLAAVEASAGRE